MLQLDFSLCLHGSGAIVQNFTGAGFDILVQWLQPGKVWDGKSQPVSDKSPRFDHKTFNGYISSVFMPITKEGANLKPRANLSRPGYRNAANVVSRSLIMLDFDAMPIGSMDRVLDELEADNVLGVVYTTYNHLNAEKGGLERFRAVVVTDRPMMAGEISRASFAFFDMLRERIPELTADNASFNPAFAMYRPPSNSIVEVFAEGEAWPVDSLLDDFDDYGLQLPVKALLADNWEPATEADMAMCEDWLEWANANNLTGIARNQVAAFAPPFYYGLCVAAARRGVGCGRAQDRKTDNGAL